jgi:succinate dehydrogenase/fumarate reductase flavoprotein subunit
LSIGKGKRTVDSFHKELGQIMWEKCGMARTEEGLTEALEAIPALREEFWRDVKVLGERETLNQSLEKAGRVADFLEFGELMCRDASSASESCGGHFREEYQTDDGEAQARRRRTSATSPPGSTRARTSLPIRTRSRSPSRTSSSPPGATSE